MVIVIMTNQNKYFVIVCFRSVNELKEQMQRDNLSEQELKKMILDGGSSPFEYAIANRNYEMANFLLSLKIPLNIVTDEGYNEFHILAPHIGDPEALRIANILLDSGVDLSQTEKRYGNTAMFSLVLEIIRHRNPDTLGFLQKCIKRNQGLYQKNKSALCAKDLIERFFDRSAN